MKGLGEWKNIPASEHVNLRIMAHILINFKKTFEDLTSPAY